eukprot:TRINITY_DN1862_c1_g1_i1.p1 TRINITY_DN1862_c1_g1~~TRINITY_DN1862_c1_g1_i1.p1  ORF type:complete len:363 (+),score=99.97 TRINITY_DN1862_c1_g1_i1:78-1166(+)
MNNNNNELESFVALFTSIIDEKKYDISLEDVYECINKIVGYLGFRDVVNMQLVSCKDSYLFKLCESDLIWKSLSINTFPELVHRSEDKEWKDCYKRKFKEGITTFDDICSEIKRISWYICPNGHLYSIGECRLPMVVSRCPTCKVRVGGKSHRMLRDNKRLVDEQIKKKLRSKDINKLNSISDFDFSEKKVGIIDEKLEQKYALTDFITPKKKKRRRKKKGKNRSHNHYKNNGSSSSNSNSNSYNNNKEEDEEVKEQDYEMGDLFGNSKDSSDDENNENDIIESNQEVEEENQKKKEKVEEEGCKYCTEEEMCLICLEKMQLEPLLESWACNKCTFVNNHYPIYCEKCGKGRYEDSSSSYIS